jgi:hypothetical protein
MPKRSRDEATVGQQDEELIPLAVGAATAYFEIDEKARILRNDEELAETAHLVAIALSTVVPIYLITTTPAEGVGALRLQSQEVNELLFAPRKLGRQARIFDGLLIRRSDLRKGIATLKAAQMAFGRN